MKNKNSSFEKYFNDYYNGVYKHLLKKLSMSGKSDYQLAEDLAMDAFVSAYQKFDLFDENKASFATWIYVIANNKLKKYYRDNKYEDELDESFIEESDFADDIVQSQYLDELRKVLVVALKSLPPIQQKIVVSRYFYNKKSNEIAENLGISPGNVRTQLSRALKDLQKHFNI